MSLLVFSSRLCDLMQTEQVSKRSLSKNIDVNRNAVLNWCDGRCCPRYDTLIRLADFFRISIDYLMGLEDECFQEFHSEFQLEQVPEVYKKRLSETLISKRISEYRLAKLLDVEQGVLSKWKKNPHLPETLMLIKIAQVLDCSLDYLLGRTP